MTNLSLTKLLLSSGVSTHAPWQPVMGSTPAALSLDDLLSYLFRANVKGWSAKNKLFLCCSSFYLISCFFCPSRTAAFKAETSKTLPSSSTSSTSLASKNYDNFRMTEERKRKITFILKKKRIFIEANKSSKTASSEIFLCPNIFRFFRQQKFYAESGLETDIRGP